MRQKGGEVSDRKVPVGGPTRLDMTPKTRSGDRYDAGPFVLFAQYALFHSNTNGKMTLCGSEVPQDRWRGRTAGSGM